MVRRFTPLMVWVTWGNATLNHCFTQCQSTFANKAILYWVHVHVLKLFERFRLKGTTWWIKISGLYYHKWPMWPAPYENYLYAYNKAKLTDVEHNRVFSSLLQGLSYELRWAFKFLCRLELHIYFPVIRIGRNKSNITINSYLQCSNTIIIQVLMTPFVGCTLHVWASFSFRDIKRM